MKEIFEDIFIVFCGQAGQGIKTIEDILRKVLKNEGYNVFTTKEYMSRVRGGFNSLQIRVSSDKVRACVDKIDILVSIIGNETGHLEKKINSDTILITETAGPLKFNYIEIPFSKIALELGSKLFANIIGVGIISGILDIKKEIISDYLKKYFNKYPIDTIDKNIEAVKKGYELGEDLLKNRIRVNIKKYPPIKDNIIISGTEGVAMGAIAGGCNFISAYPMSPSTGVLTFMAQHARDFGIIVEQAEDEIASINMSIGAWCGGARAMTTTSGGGFALMSEGLSLAGICECPFVIHLAQRPGPATGLPTRTSQGDLELVLYSGHGDFPRIILAPGTIEEAFELSKKAFNFADKYQVPVFILTDQFFVDTYYNVDKNSLNISDTDIKHAFIETDETYKRYSLTENGISPRGIYGYGNGLICIDSHEHDEEGHISEDFELTVKMQNKRIKKLDFAVEDLIKPVMIGNDNYDVLIIGWGSTYEIIKEAFLKLNRKDMAFLHYNMVYPLYEKTSDYLKKSKKTIIVENNLTGQFGKLIRTHTGIEIKDKILKYDGLPFSVEEILTKIKEILDQEKIYE